MIITVLRHTSYGNMDAIGADQDRHNRMARKKKVKRFRAVQAVKELARERVGAPPAGRVVLEKKKKPEKHKPTLERMLGDQD